MPKKLTQFDFVKKANLKHNYLYDYSLSVYEVTDKKVIIKCPIHKNFKQTPHSHLQGQGCPKCALIKRTKTQTFTTKQFIEKSNKVHNFKYDYTSTNYKRAQNKVNIICPIHGIFKQAAYDHLGGHGCKKCSTHSLNLWSRKNWINFCNSKPCTPIVYIIRCFNKNENFIKIGITSNTIKYRFKSKLLPYPYEIIKEIKGTPDFVYDKEKEFHLLYKDFKYIPLISFAGQSECFDITILKDF